MSILGGFDGRQGPPPGQVYQAVFSITYMHQGKPKVLEIPVRADNPLVYTQIAAQLCQGGFYDERNRVFYPAHKIERIEIGLPILVPDNQIVTPAP